MFPNQWELTNTYADWPFNPGVEGSIPSRPTSLLGCLKPFSAIQGIYQELSALSVSSHVRAKKAPTFTYGVLE